MSGYLLVAMIVNYLKHGAIEATNKSLVVHIFDGGTFALSCALLAGVFEPIIIKLIGNITIFLIISALAGIAYSIRNLFVS